MSVAPKVESTPEAMGVPPAAGGCAVLQGAYGERGNLELLFPDPIDGLWVCWRNNDPEAVGEVGPGGWSAGLRFATGERYDDVAFLQARRGPDFLELLASAGSRLDRWTWSPGPGFERTGALEIPDAGRPTDLQLFETHRGFAAVARVDDTCVVWRADGTTYPHLSWTEPDCFVLPDDIEQSAVTMGADDSIRALAVRSGRLWSCDDLAAPEWTGLGIGEVDAICAVARTPRDPTAGPDFAVVAGQRLVVISGRDRLGFELAMPRISALAAGASRVEATKLEVVVRTDHELRHLTL